MTFRSIFRAIHSRPFGYCIFKSLVILLLDVLFIWASVSLVLKIDFMDPVAQAVEGFNLTDIYYSALKHDRVDTCETITLVDVTDLYQRDDLALVFQEIHDMEPAVMGVDIAFEGMKDDPVASETLREVVTSCPEAVFAFKMENYNSETKQFDHIVHSFFAEDGKVQEGYVNTNAKKAGEVERRLTMRYDLDGKTTYHLTAAVVRQYLGAENCHWENEAQNQIDYTPKVFRKVRYDELAEHPEYIKSRIVLIGGVEDYSDMHFTPIGKLHGIELWAYNIDTLLQNRETKVLTGTWYYVISLLLGFLYILFYCCYRHGVSILGRPFVAYVLTMSMTYSVIVTFTLLGLMLVGFWVFHAWNYDLRLALPISIILLSSNVYSVYVALELFIRHHVVGWFRSKKRLISGRRPHRVMEEE